MQRPEGPTQQTFTPAFSCITFDSALTSVAAEFILIPELRYESNG